MQLLRVVSNVVFIIAVFIIGVNIGLCVKVLIVRSVPVIHGGGELVLLLAVPASVVAGYIAGIKKTKRRRPSDETIGHTD